MDGARRHAAILRALHQNGSVRVTELADRLSVTPITVRRDLTLLEQRGTLTRVHGGATLADPFPRQPRPAQRPAPAAARDELTFGMVVPAGYYYRPVIEGARAAAEANRGRLVVGVSQYDPDEDRRQLEQLLDMGIHGLLLTPSAPTGELADSWKWITDLPVPVVIVERRHNPVADFDPFESVCTDHERGATQAVRHLAGLGHRRIALLAGPTPTSPWLRRGFDAAGAAFGLADDVPRLSDVSLGHITASQLDDTVDAVLAARATAVLVHPDDAAVVFLQQLRSRAVAVPEEMSIVAYDDEFAALADLPLTAVAPQRHALGRTAVELLIRRLREGDARAMSHVQLLPRLSVRASTAPPRTADAP